MIPTAVRNPSRGIARPRIRWYIGANTSSIRLQKIHRSHAVRNAGTVTKKPAMNRTLSQFFMLNSRIAPRATSHGRVRARAGPGRCAKGAGARGAPGRGDPAADHRAQQVAEGREAHEWIALLLAGERRG